jgi:hypothetical protein
VGKYKAHSVIKFKNEQLQKVIASTNHPRTWDEVFSPRLADYRPPSPVLIDLPLQAFFCPPDLPLLESAQAVMPF